jgi:hypothetical protein
MLTLGVKLKLIDSRKGRSRGKFAEFNATNIVKKQKKAFKAIEIWVLSVNRCFQHAVKLMFVDFKLPLI